ncbi:3-oxoacyl-ACP reductase [Planosporangium mesophilum]|uniref:3-oxoacyl-ACP reductase n=1 Tax=Planosporangium mesophilum TaxID=689768 RepID=A0A8J3TGH5_9ACTN|nr:3-oxoacyl-ACP reductase [Planosporangium mesophilum]NJC82468.1 3-oxoacyl-ACP reductase [Planosporangium mesophilum]GII26023.1 3-oxoacyl-ACP reductase [Planosporangium mesophilum]
MSDRYTSFANTTAGRAMVKRLGLPEPVRLRRYRAGDPDIEGTVLVGGAGRLAEPVRKLLREGGASTEGEGPYTGLVFDATGIADSTGLRALYDFFHPVARSLRPCGRVVVLGTPPEECGNPREATAQRALEGFVRSVAKEFGRGTTAQLVYVAPGAEDAVESTLRFLLSPKSAYVSGQVVRVGAADVTAPANWTRPLEGKVALVTGAARGIGEAIARVLARDGAHVVCLDVPAAGQPLSAVANDIKGSALQLDLTSTDAPQRLVEYFSERNGRVDIVVHNAGITRDKTLARMSEDKWDVLMDINLSSQERVNDALLAADLLPSGGRIVAVSSMSGIAGNRGQTNYAASKAGVIGLVQFNAPVLASKGVTINAVAPGFIETQMTAAMPMVVREGGRRMNSMSQGGQPVDVAETIAWFASPGSAGLTGNVVRVCGQSLLGA